MVLSAKKKRVIYKSQAEKKESMDLSLLICSRLAGEILSPLMSVCRIDVSESNLASKALMSVAAREAS